MEGKNINSTQPISDIDPTEPPPELNSTQNNNQSVISISGSHKLKLIVIPIAITLLLVLSVYGISVPTINMLSVCIKNMNSDIKSSDQMKISQHWTKEQFCLKDKDIVVKFISCVNDANAKILIPVGIANFLGGIINPSVKSTSKNNVINLHNSFCNEYPESLVN